MNGGFFPTHITYPYLINRVYTIEDVSLLSMKFVNIGWEKLNMFLVKWDNSSLYYNEPYPL